MFEDFQKVEKSDAPKRMVSTITAIALEAALVGAMLIVPLIFVNALPDGYLVIAQVLAPPPPPPPPPLGDSSSKAIAPVTPTEQVTIIKSTEFIKPIETSEILPVPPDIPIKIGLGVPQGMIGGVPGGTIGGMLGGVLGGALGGVPGGVLNNYWDRNSFFLPLPVIPPPPPPRNTITREAVKIGGIVLESRLLHKVEPSYPEIARRAGIQGKVIMMVNVDESGNVSDIRVQNGHPLLRNAAEDAVKLWRYSPTLLNGEPVPVVATVTVIFSLS